MSGGKTAGFHLAVKRRPREWDQGEHLLYAQHRPNLSGSRVLFTFVCVDHSPSCPQRSRSGHPATRRATRTCVFANPENVGRVDHPEHHAQARPKWNGGCKLIVRLGATAHKKERSCPRFLIVEFFGVGAMHAARSGDEGTSPIVGARVHRDRKQGSDQLLISLLVRKALEPVTSRAASRAGGFDPSRL